MALRSAIATWFDPATIVSEYRTAWNTPGYVVSVLVALLLLGGALYVNFWAIGQATQKAGQPIDDLVLSTIPVYDVDGLFINGTFVVIFFSALIVLSQPRSIPFVLHGLIVFILIRSGFTLLTHLGPPEAYYASDFGVKVTRAFYGSDQFFSGHTGMPFLGALAYWHKRWIRNLFLAATLYFVIIVFMGHIHYSIDVASAFFITYGIFEIVKHYFPEEYAFFVSHTSA